MPSIRDLRVKIKSIKNIQQITKAMKMVSAARLKKAQSRLDAARPYARKIAEVTLDLAARNPEATNPLLTPHGKTKRILILVFTGDRGLAGGFHQKIADGAAQFGKKFQGEAEAVYYSIGLKGTHRLHLRRIPIFKKYDKPVLGVTFETATELAKEIIDFYLKEEFDQIYLYYAKFQSVMSQRPRAFQLLPLNPKLLKEKEGIGLYIFEPGIGEILDGILPRYVESEIFRAFLETEAGELGARMTAMSSATDNAEELIESYQLQYNKIRQSQITKEIAEIVGGAEVLKQ